jgi:glyoxylase-like metal-dependent hydrolase (beta-lactamase superfamily II)
MRITNHVYVLSGSYYSAGGQSGLLGEVYAIDAPDGLILIDSGYTKDGLAQINENLDYYNLPKQPRCLILTHAHYDHCGNALAFQRLGAKVIVGAEDAYQCVNGGSAGLDIPTPFDDAHIYPAFTPNATIDADCAKEICGLTLRFIKIPGHTPGHLAILVDIDGKRIVFTGDALCPTGDALLDSVTLGWQGDIKFSRDSVVNSMMHLLREAPDADIILSGHGKACLKNGGAMIRLAAQTAFLTMR